MDSAELDVVIMIHLEMVLKPQVSVPSTVLECKNKTYNSYPPNNIGSRNTWKVLEKYITQQNFSNKYSQFSLKQIPLHIGKVRNET